MPAADDLTLVLKEAGALRERGQFADAAARYEQVVAAAPHLATAWYNLGFCQRMTGRFEEALQSYRRAIEGGLSGAEEAHLNRAVILGDVLRRESEAGHELDKALALNPRYLPALLNRGNLAEDMGQRDTAIGLYERALAAAPESANALARLANLLPAGPPLAALLPRLQRAIAGAGLRERAELGFALGRALDALGRYNEAFDAYSRANTESRSAFNMRYDRTAAEAQAEAIKAVFSAPHRPSRDADAWAPVFICGMFRSGSTLAEQVLAGHPRLTPCGEMAIVPALVSERLTPFPERALEDAGAHALADKYRRRVRALFPAVDLATDKWLGNFLYVGLIKRMFPAAKIVHTLRNPLDNAISVYFLHLDPSMGYAADLDDIAHQSRLVAGMMAHWRALYPEDVIVFDYDAFVARPRETAQSLVEALGLAWDEECLAFHRRTNAVKTASVWQVRQPLYATSSGRWKNYAAQLQRASAALADLL
jgi:tetratricopeptide (TPR) repeat protein